ncbi:creatininase family protein [Catellatospora methionotrophica]|uniref:creatininase family protein n=1 Tax=Catellatospora methionotrophica TaxID=121620 RepID=UPI00340B067F
MNILPTTTATEVAAQGARIAVIPVGSFEQHGSHLPLSTDTIIACAIAEAISTSYGLFLLPPIPIACSHEHASWPGTVSISAATLHRLLHDIIDSLHRSGVHKVVIVNGHGGNYVLANVVQELSVDGPNIALFPRPDDWDKARNDADLGSGGHEDMHAGEIETSLLLYLVPAAVKSDYRQADSDGTDRRKHLLTLGLQAYTSTGVVGRPSLADAAKGKAVLDSLTASFAEYLTVLDSAVPDLK